MIRSAGLALRHVAAPPRGGKRRKSMTSRSESSAGPALNRLMSDACRRRFDAILVWKIDRFGRCLKRLVNALAELAALGVAFISLRDNVTHRLHDQRQVQGLAYEIAGPIPQGLRLLRLDFSAVLRAFDVLASNGQLDMWRLLHVLHPLAIYVRCTSVKPVAIQNEPDRNFVRLPGFASVMGQPRRLLCGHLPQSRKFGRFHKLLLATFNMNRQ